MPCVFFYKVELDSAESEILDEGQGIIEVVSFSCEIFDEYWPMRGMWKWCNAFSMVDIFKKKSPLHLPPTLHLKSPTQGGGGIFPNQYTYIHKFFFSVTSRTSTLTATSTNVRFVAPQKPPGTLFLLYIIVFFCIKSFFLYRQELLQGNVTVLLFYPTQLNFDKEGFINR